MESFYEQDGIKLNKDGIQASVMFDQAIREMYLHWIEKGYSPSETKEIILTQVFITTGFVNAMKS